MGDPRLLGRCRADQNGEQTGQSAGEDIGENLVSDHAHLMRLETQLPNAAPESPGEWLGRAGNMGKIQVRG